MIHIDVNISGDRYLIVTQPLGGFDIYHVSRDEYPARGKRLISHRSTVVSALRWLEEELCVELNEYESQPQAVEEASLHDKLTKLERRAAELSESWRGKAMGWGVESYDECADDLDALMREG